VSDVKTPSIHAVEPSKPEDDPYSTFLDFAGPFGRRLDSGKAGLLASKSLPCVDVALELLITRFSIATAVLWPP